MFTSCFSPELRLSPPSETIVSKPSFCSKFYQIPHILRASTILASLWQPDGSTFSLIVPLYMKWSWRMILMFDLSYSKLSLLVSWPSISILPEDPSIILSNPNIKVLFPLPVLPTIPIFYPDLIIKLMFFKTSYC
jgi:hypothetical protein